MKKDLNIIPYFMQNSSKNEMRRNTYYALLLWIAALMPVMSKDFWENGGNGMLFFSQVIGCSVFVGVTYYCFLQIFQTPEIAAMCAALYVLTVQRDGGEVAIFSALTIIWYELYQLITQEEQGKKRGIRLLLLALCLCVAAYLDMKYFESIAVMVMLLAGTNVCIQKKIRTLAEVVITFVPALPVMLLRIKSVSDISLIQEKGEFLSDSLLQFNVFLFGGILGLLALWGMGYLRNNKKENSFLCAMLIAVMGMMILSLRIFPWDRIQYINEFTYKWIGLLESPGIFAETALICLIACWGEVLRKSKKYAGHWYCLCTVGMLVTILFTGIYATEKGQIASDEIMRMQMQSGIEEIIYENDQE